MDGKAIIHTLPAEASGAHAGKPFAFPIRSEKARGAAFFERCFLRALRLGKARFAGAQIRNLSLETLPKPLLLIPAFIGLALSGCGGVVSVSPNSGGYYDSGSDAGAADDGYADAPEGEPDYIYGDVSYYYIGGRYFYYRHHRRYYVASLPAGGKYHHHGGGHGQPINRPSPKEYPHPNGNGSRPQVHQGQQIRGPVPLHHFIPQEQNAPKGGKPRPQEKEKKKEN
jgi:hypothetical protein